MLIADLQRGKQRLLQETQFSVKQWLLLEGHIRVRSESLPLRLPERNTAVEARRAGQPEPPELEYVAILLIALQDSAWAKQGDEGLAVPQ